MSAGRRSIAVLLAATWLLATAPSPVCAEPLRLVSYNIHGIGFLLGQLKVPSWTRTRIAAIGHELRAYDVAMVQEDFAYHATLAGALPESRMHRGGGPTFRWGYLVTAPLWLPLLAVFNVGLWPVFNGDGLTIVVNDPGLTVEPLARERYARCGDYVLGGNDCFAAKGFLATRLTLRNGATVDLYDTHLEAGAENELFSKDRRVRRSQLEHLADAIDRHSRGRAVVVAGDLNTDALVDGAFKPVRRLMEVAGLSDSRAWTTITDARWRRRVDHLLYRNGCGARLGVPVVGAAEAFRTAGGRPLSDHPALAATFDVQPGDAAGCP